MEKLINFKNIHKFAYVNDKLCSLPIQGIVVSFFGLGFNRMLQDENPQEGFYAEEGKFYAENNILYVFPYNNPWNWMNRQAVSWTDELLDVLFLHFDLPENTPVVAAGGSMGGLSALTYTAYAKRTPVACIANCPVCDLPFHFTERPDLPRTLYSAFYNYEGTLQQALESASPLHLADRMPLSTEYTVFHCECDSAVNIEKHSVPFVEKMKKTHQIDFIRVPDRDHCDLPENLRAEYLNKAKKAIYKNNK